MQIDQVTPKDLIGPLNEVERKNAPETLFVSGDVGLCRNFPRVSVIGTRKISPLGVRSTENLVRLLVKRGVAVVSGLALGVDACAHKSIRLRINPYVCGVRHLLYADDDVHFCAISLMSWRAMILRWIWLVPS